jgi:hypothetical protein
MTGMHKNDELKNGSRVKHDLETSVKRKRDLLRIPDKSAVKS